jgi:regulator of cell morphogenesis and NO signaling
MHTPHTVSPTTPTSTDLAQQSLGEIAVALPGATAVFRRLKLDFCCGGQVRLVDACAAKGLDADALVTELKALVRDDAAPAAPEPAALVDHIVSRYHEVHRAQLPELIRMARRVEAVHRDNPHVPVGLADHLERMDEELRDHMAKEEGVLFPMLKAGGHPMVSQPISMMRHEHVDHGEHLARLAELTNDHTPLREPATPGVPCLRARDSCLTI